MIGALIAIDERRNVGVAAADGVQSEGAAVPSRRFCAVLRRMRPDPSFSRKMRFSSFKYSIPSLLLPVDPPGNDHEKDMPSVLTTSRESYSRVARVERG